MFGPVERHAIGDQLLAPAVIGALAAAPVEQLARDVGRVEHAGVLILELVDAAAPTAVAQSLPLAAVERGQGLFPERRFWPQSVGVVHDKLSHGLLSHADQAQAGIEAI